MLKLTDISEVCTASIIRVISYGSDDGRQYAPLKRRSTSTWLHGATSQKTLNFILTTVRAWNLTTTGKAEQRNTYGVEPCRPQDKKEVMCSSEVLVNTGKNAKIYGITVWKTVLLLCVN
jgi:hypothetical protein